MKFLLFISVLVSLSMVVYSAVAPSKDQQDALNKELTDGLVDLRNEAAKVIKSISESSTETTLKNEAAALHATLLSYATKLKADDLTHVVAIINRKRTASSPAEEKIDDFKAGLLTPFDNPITTATKEQVADIKAATQVLTGLLPKLPPPPPVAPPTSSLTPLNIVACIVAFGIGAGAGAVGYGFAFGDKGTSGTPISSVRSSKKSQSQSPMKKKTQKRSNKSR